MLRKEKGEQVMICDSCDKKAYAGTLAFHEFIDCIKKAGWVITKDNNQYIHTCPDCVEAEEGK